MVKKFLFAILICIFQQIHAQDLNGSQPTQDLDKKENNEYNKQKTEESKKKYHVYAGLNFSNSITFEGRANNNAYTATVDLKTPAILIGANFYPLQYEGVNFIIGGSYELTRNFEKTVEKVGTSSPTTNTNSTLKLDVASIAFLAEKEIIKGATIFGGPTYNFVYITGTTVTNWELDSGLGFQLGTSLTYQNFRSELIYKVLGGNFTATNNTTNASGDYSYNHFVLTIGMLF